MASVPRRSWHRGSKQRRSCYSSINSFLHTIAANARNACRLDSGHESKMRLHPDSSTGISHLVALCCPSAVFRPVPLLVVCAFKRKPIDIGGRHVAMKVLHFSPLWAHPDSPSSVVAEVGVPWIEAARQHCYPDIINGRVCKAVSSTRLKPNSSQLQGKAPAAFCVAGPESIGEHLCHLSAFAQAPPPAKTAGTSLCLIKNSQSVVPGSYRRRVTLLSCLTAKASATFSVSALERPGDYLDFLATVAATNPSPRRTSKRVYLGGDCESTELYTKGKRRTLAGNRHAVSPKDRCGGQGPQRGDTRCGLVHFTAARSC